MNEFAFRYSLVYLEFQQHEKAIRNRRPIVQKSCQPNFPQCRQRLGNAIKIKLGKMVFKDTLENIINEQQTVNGIQILSVSLAHALYLENLPPHHKDPFDRLLISQAIVENMTLVSADANFANSQVNSY